MKKAVLTSTKSANNEIRADILEAAALVFGREGYEKATLDEIAAVVGIKKGSLYYHIKSKEQLLYEIHCKLNKVLSNRLIEAVGDGGAPALEQVQRVVEAIVYTVVEYRAMVRVFLRDHRSLKGADLKNVIAHRRAVLTLIEDVVGKAISEEKREDLDARLTVYAIIGMCYWVNEWLDGSDKKATWPIARIDDPAVIADCFTRILLGGLRSSGLKGPGLQRSKPSLTP
jgi:AcrR family transcriptional regulator